MLNGKNALVTGSTRGLGEATAKVLAAEGCNVMLNGFGDADEIETLRAGMEAEYGVSVRYHGADLADAAQIDALVDETIAAFGSVDILVNNAVIRYFHKIDDFDRDEWNHALAVNLTAPFILTQRVLPGMRSKEWGRIVNISSVLGLSGQTGRADYVTTKTALIGLTRATAAETSDSLNITCNAINPGSVLTPNSEKFVNQLAEEKGIGFDAAAEEYLLRRRQPGGFVLPERAGKLIAFLCQDSSFDITGTSIPIDHGRSGTWLQDRVAPDRPL